MILDRIARAADSSDGNSLANRFRRARFKEFESIVDATLPQTGGKVRIIDLGGTVDYWEKMGVAHDSRYVITTVNLEEPDAGAAHPNIEQIQGDATHVRFADNTFDIVFSNSAIEHVGDISRQTAMADEVRRLAPTYYVQTPARSFPIEPHFRSPLCHPYLPPSVREWEMGRVRHVSRDEARRILGTVSLLRRRELATMFPDATITRERFAGLTKSWIAIRRARP